MLPLNYVGTYKVSGLPLSFNLFIVKQKKTAATEGSSRLERDDVSRIGLEQCLARSRYIRV